MAASAYTIPGVYYEPRPRAEPRPLVRTDVAGFIGFETRVRDGTTPSRMIEDPLSGSVVGHAFRVDLAGFQLPAGLLGDKRVKIPAHTDLVLSENPSKRLIESGGSIRYAVAALLETNGQVRILTRAGPVSPEERAAAVADAEFATLAAGLPWVRIADIEFRRAAVGNRVFPTVIPALPPARCDDWSDFELQLGGIPAPDDGTFLARAVRMYFANGGARCHVATIRRPLFDDAVGLQQALEDLVGVEGASETEATGLERLLRIFEVAVVDAPDLYARRVDPDPTSRALYPIDHAACFQPCGDTPVVRVAVNATGEHAAGGPLFADGDVLDAQRAMLRRCGPESWRVLLLLAAPVDLEPSTGVFRGPDARRALAWRQSLADTVDDLAASCAAFYHPWALSQERLGAPLVELPPTALAAGVIARRDLARGSHVAPANERLVGVVGLSPPLDDAEHAALYEPPININPFRSLPGLGIQVLGARTLSGDRWLRYLPVRRCLSAIERRALAALRPLVFEPNTPTLWFQITQAVLGILVPLFNTGALRGEVPEQAFYVRCDETNNASDTIEAGQVLCEVGVAIAAPAEFIVFRVGRREAVVEVLE
jgi:hypothetical protein